MEKTEKRTPPEIARIIIDRLGGTGAAAELCGIAPASVSGWKAKGISELRTDFLKIRRPDVFVDLAETKTEASAA